MGVAETTGPEEVWRTLVAGFEAADFAGFRDALQTASSMDELAELGGPFGELNRELIDPSVIVEADLPITAMVGSRFTGWDGWIEFWRGWLEPWARYQIEFPVHEIRDEHVIAQLDFAASGRGSGIEVSESVIQAWTIRDGKVIALRMYPRMEDALQDLVGTPARENSA